MGLFVQIPVGWLEARRVLAFCETQPIAFSGSLGLIVQFEMKWLIGWVLSLFAEGVPRRPGLRPISANLTLETFLAFLVLLSCEESRFRGLAGVGLAAS